MTLEEYLDQLAEEKRMAEEKADADQFTERKRQKDFLDKYKEHFDRTLKPAVDKILTLFYTKGYGVGRQPTKPLHFPNAAYQLYLRVSLKRRFVEFFFNADIARYQVELFAKFSRIASNDNIVAETKLDFVENQSLDVVTADYLESFIQREFAKLIQEEK